MVPISAESVRGFSLSVLDQLPTMVAFSRSEHETTTISLRIPIASRLLHDEPFDRAHLVGWFNCLPVTVRAFALRRAVGMPYTYIPDSVMSTWKRRRMNQCMYIILFSIFLFVLSLGRLPTPITCTCPTKRERTRRSQKKDA